MNKSNQFINSLFLLRLLGYELICVNKDLFNNTWAWSFDLTNEQTFLSSYTKQQVSILMTPNLYDAKNFELTRQALNHSQKLIPTFKIWLKANALNVLLDEKILMVALNKLVFISRREYETLSNLKAESNANPQETP